MGKGLSWGLLAVFLATLIRLGLAPIPGLAAETRRLALVLGGSVLACWFLMLKIDDRTLWALVYGGVPGGGSIRSVFRFNLVLSFSVVTVAAIGMHGAWLWATQAAPRARWRPVAVAVLAVALAAEQVNTLPACLSRSRDFAAIEAMPPVPGTCRALVLLPAAPPTAYHRWSRQLDAVMAAQARGLPTLNGYSGQAPSGWALFDPTDRAGYGAAVGAWADRYDLWSGLCGLDLQGRRWFPVSRRDLLP